MFKFYQQQIFPHILNQVMQTPSLMDARRELLNPIEQECLEIGFGTGVNLPFYSNMDVLYALEPNTHIWQLATERLKQTPFMVEHLAASAENIPLANASMQHVVSTWTMCSIPNLKQALQEIHRVLADDGTFHFVEHVLSDRKSMQNWQNLLTPIQTRLADGCHLNRNIEKAVIDAGFEFVEKDYFLAAGIPSIGQRMLLGRVKKKSN